MYFVNNKKFNQIKWFFLNKIMKKYGIHSIGFNQNSFKFDLEEQIIKANYIKLLFCMGYRTLTVNDALLAKWKKNKKNETINFKILILNPNSDFLKIRAEEMGDDYVTVKKQHKFALENAIQLKNKYKNIEIRLYDMLPVWRIVQLDDTMYVSYYLKGNYGADTSMYKLIKSNETLYQAFERYFGYIWDYASEDCFQVD